MRSPETVERHRAAMKKAYQNPDVLARVTQLNRMKAQDPTFRAKLSAGVSRARRRGV